MSAGATERWLRGLEAKYEVLEKLSEGGMGAVYTVRHRLLGRVRVIKVMRPQLVTDAEMRARFVREARLAGSLRHPNIAQVYDFAMSESGMAYLVMEYVPGITLQEMLQRSGPPSVGLAAELAAQTLEALAYLHRRGVIHRDLSPDNIMVMAGEDGRPLVKLIDLGIAKLVDSTSQLTQEGSFIGKVRYASPELFRTRDGTRVDHRSDLYSVGVVLYELLTGHHPIGELDVSGYIAGHLLQPPRPFTETDPEGRVPPELRAVVLESLAKDPADRPPDAQTMAATLRAVCRACPYPPRELAEILERCERHRAAGAGATSVAGPTDIRSLIESVDEELLALRPEPGGEGAVPTASGPRAFETVPHAEESRTARLRGPATRRRRARLVAGTVLAVAVGGAAAWIARTRPAAPPMGAAVLDAEPWARVAKVVDASGHALPLPADAATPLRLELRPGRYTVELRRGEALRRVAIEVPPGGVARAVATFAAPTPEEVLAALGLGAPGEPRVRSRGPRSP